MAVNREQQESTRKYYNNYSSSQKIIGVNIRHRTILKKAISEGMNDKSSVLEIGCGIGTFTSLLAKEVSQGEVLAVDISDESIKQAKRNLEKHKNISFQVTDMSDFKLPDRFDFFIFPDVLEHIPIDQHEALFQTLAAHSHKKSKILIHLPHPTFIEWLANHEPEKMQIIDQPVHSDQLTSDAYKSGWILDKLISYSLYHENPDYQWIVLKRNVPYDTMEKRGKVTLKIADFRSKL